MRIQNNVHYKIQMCTYILQEQQISDIEGSKMINRYAEGGIKLCTPPN